MGDSVGVIVGTVIGLAVIYYVLNLVRTKRIARKFTPLTGIALVLVVAGMAAGVVGQASDALKYGLIGAGVVVAAVDIVMQLRGQ